MSDADSNSGDEAQPINLEDRIPQEDKNFIAMQKDGLFTDVKLVCDDGVAIPCHSVILAARSSHFKNILSSRRQEDGSYSIRISLCSSRNVRCLIAWLYKDFLMMLDTFPTAFEDNQAIIELHALALKAEIYGLVEYCEHCMKGRMRADCKTAPDFYHEGFVTNRCCLQTAAMECIRDNFDEVEKTESWKDLAKNHPDAILQVLAFVCKKE